MEYTAPRLMLIQFDYQKGKMAPTEAKSQMELLLKDMKKSVKDAEIVLENTDLKGLKRARNLLHDGQQFYEQILIKHGMNLDLENDKDLSSYLQKIHMERSAKSTATLE